VRYVSYQFAAECKMKITNKYFELKYFRTGAANQNFIQQENEEH
jgi:hypothetical protein